MIFLPGTNTCSQSTGHDLLNFGGFVREKKNAFLVDYVEFRFSFRNQDTTSFKNLPKKILLHRHFNSISNLAEKGAWGILANHLLQQ